MHVGFLTLKGLGVGYKTRYASKSLLQWWRYEYQGSSHSDQFKTAGYRITLLIFSYWNIGVFYINRNERYSLLTSECFFLNSETRHSSLAGLNTIFRSSQLLKIHWAVSHLVHWATIALISTDHRGGGGVRTHHASTAARLEQQCWWAHPS